MIIGLAIAAVLLLLPRDDGEKKVGDVSEEQTKPDLVLTRAEEILGGMTLEEKVGQMFVVNTANLEYSAGGVILFAADVHSAAQVKTYNANVQANSKYGMLIGTDQEGGIVDRLQNAGVTRFGNMATIGATGDASKAYNVGVTYGKEMKALGFNVDFAPVADVNTNPNNPVIGVRSFGSDAGLVSKMVAAEVKGLQENGVAATLKHFPGHGDTSTDSHTGAVSVQSDLARLRAVELLPFKAGIDAGADMVLSAHIKLPNVDSSGLPATMSKKILTDILRGELEFDGVIITDSLGMGAISNYYSTEQVVMNCVSAGVDMMLMPVNYVAAHGALLKYVQDGKISEDRIDESVLRILNLKLKLGALK